MVKHETKSHIFLYAEQFNLHAICSAQLTSKALETHINKSTYLCLIRRLGVLHPVQFYKKKFHYANNWKCITTDS